MATAIENDDAEAAMRLLDLSRQNDGLLSTQRLQTFLLRAAKLGSVRVAEALIKANVSIESTTLHGETALHFAAANVLQEKKKKKQESEEKKRKKK